MIINLTEKERLFIISSTTVAIETALEALQTELDECQAETAKAICHKGFSILRKLGALPSSYTD